MSKLTGDAILDAIESATIKISDFDSRYLGPNSYDLALGPNLLVYKPRRWWTPWRPGLIWGKTNPPDFTVKIPEQGYWIRPGWFYLGSTQEWTETYGYVPALDGRSTTGRTSLHIHVTAGFGDIGFCGCWTMEIHSIIPVKIHAGDRICQISYHTVHGSINRTYHGRYAEGKEPLYALKSRD
jgi:dCTP deaminase